MTPEQLYAALNHSWICLKDGYYYPICNRFFPLGIWANVEEDKRPPFWNSQQRFPAHETHVRYKRQ